MKQKHILMAVLRLGCGLIDLLLIQLPVQLLMLGVMDLDASQVDLLFRLLFAVYGALMIEYNHGATVGKSIGRLAVVDVSGAKAPILYVGLRELVRSMYKGHTFWDTEMFILPYVRRLCHVRKTGRKGILSAMGSQKAFCGRKS